jgi:NAD(P)-dependent dehydrogenase (short-subunit alcohol dehydrogenase family)
LPEVFNVPRQRAELVDWREASVLVTGGASGLGRAVATTMAAAGGSVVIADLPQSDGDVVANSLGEAVRFVPTDVTDPEQVRAAVAAAAELAPLRAAVCCAGVATPGRILGRNGPLATEDFARVVQINLVGTFTVISIAAQAMAANEPVDGDRGVIVCTSSIAAYDGQVGQAAYAASKGGVASLTLAAARDLAQYGIRVVSVAPGLFDTPLMAGLSEEVRVAMAQSVPHPARLGDPAEFAALVEHVLDNRMLNGEVIRLDGALRMPPR